MKIGFFETEPWEEEYIRESLTGFDCSFNHDPIDMEKASQETDADLSSYEAISVFIKSRVDEALLERMPNLRLIATRSTGFDHIDVDACKRRSVAVANVPTYGENTVAEHTFGLILSLSRKIHQAHVRTTAGNFSLGGLTGFDLHSKTLGVIGAGSIGLHVIRIAKGFAMDVIAYDPRPNQLIAEVLGFKYAPLETVLGSADVVTLHAPYTPATHHLIGKDSLAQMKEGAILINTARGGLIDTQALLDAIDSGHLDGAGLDVLEGEDLITEERELLASEGAEEKLKAVVLSHLLLRRENVVITPHIAFDSKEALGRILETTLGNVRAFVEGQPRNLLAPYLSQNRAA